MIKRKHGIAGVHVQYGQFLKAMMMATQGNPVDNLKTPFPLTAAADGIMVQDQVYTAVLTNDMDSPIVASRIHASVIAKQEQILFENNHQEGSEYEDARSELKVCE